MDEIQFTSCTTMTIPQVMSEWLKELLLQGTKENPSIVMDVIVVVLMSMLEN